MHFLTFFFLFFDEGSLHLIIKPANKPDICRKIRPKATKRLLQTAKFTNIGPSVGKKAHVRSSGQIRQSEHFQGPIVFFMYGYTYGNTTILHSRYKFIIYLAVKLPAELTRNY